MDFRELDDSETIGYTFSDYFRIHVTMRMDRDEALAIAQKVEHYVSSIKHTNDSPRVFVSVLDRNN